MTESIITKAIIKHRRAGIIRLFFGIDPLYNDEFYNKLVHVPKKDIIWNNNIFYIYGFLYIKNNEFVVLTKKFKVYKYTSEKFVGREKHIENILKTHKFSQAELFARCKLCETSMFNVMIDLVSEKDVIVKNILL